MLILRSGRSEHTGWFETRRPPSRASSCLTEANDTCYYHPVYETCFYYLLFIFPTAIHELVEFCYITMLGISNIPVDHSARTEVPHPWSRTSVRTHIAAFIINICNVNFSTCRGNLVPSGTSHDGGDNAHLSRGRE